MREMAAPLGHLLVTKAASALPVPAAAGAGVDITSWRSGAFGPTRAIVYLYGPPGSIEGPVLWGRRHARWHFIGVLNQGVTITITGPTQGYAEPIAIAGVFDELAVSGTGAVDIVQEFEPVEVQA